jgi:riboflavin kinase/FMN adenylyltransferase
MGEAMVLPSGVYFADVLRLGASIADAPGGELMPAVVNIGRAPTFDAGAAQRAADDRGAAAFDPARDRVEVHILDAELDLYGEYLEVSILSRHRSERRFDSVAALIEQIRRDVDLRRAFAREEERSR